MIVQDWQIQQDVNYSISKSCNFLEENNFCNCNGQHWFHVARVHDHSPLPVTLLDSYAYYATGNLDSPNSVFEFCTPVEVNMNVVFSFFCSCGSQAVSLNDDSGILSWLGVIGLKRTWVQKLSSCLLLMFMTTPLLQITLRVRVTSTSWLPAILETPYHDSLDVPHQSSTGDQHRVRTKVPRVSYTGDNFASMSSVLNKWLSRKMPNSRRCDEFSKRIQNPRHTEGSWVERRPQRLSRCMTSAAWAWGDDQGVGVPESEGRAGLYASRRTLSRGSDVVRSSPPRADEDTQDGWE